MVVVVLGILRIKRKRGGRALVVAIQTLIILTRPWMSAEAAFIGICSRDSILAFCCKPNADWLLLLSMHNLFMHKLACG